MSKNQPTLSAAPGGTAPAQPTDAVTKSDTATAPGNSPSIAARIDRLKLWHTGAKASATRLKLFVFLAGLEGQAIKDVLGIVERRRTDLGETAETISAVTGGESFSNWIEAQTGITYRTFNNYITAYFNMDVAAPEIAGRIRAASDIRLESHSAPLALQTQIEESIRKISPADIEAFSAALDPWNLSDLYQKPLKPAQVREQNEEAKAKSDLRDRDHQLEFWFDEFEKKAERFHYLKLPRPHREALLERLTGMIRDLKDSLRNKETL
jgi:hypothetical protein